MEGLLDVVVHPSEETWARMYEETGRLQRLVDDLLELSRAEARQLSLQLRHLRDAPVRGAVGRVQPAYAAAAKAVALETDIPPNLSEVYANVGLALQVLINLLGNCTIRTRPTVRVAGTQTGRSDMALSVSDSGVGIPTEHLAS
jgi:signal transduction histidine kinase